jgi:N-acetylmuramoyl-L-alanine amidase
MQAATPHAPHGGRLTRARRTIARLALALCCTSVLHAGPPPSYDKALRMREALEAQPQHERTRRDYERVLDAFRAIYHDAPRSSDASASVAAVAELLAEQGRLFATPKASQDAISQYEFLRREYPSSPYHNRALLAEGEVYAHDLDDRVAARTIFKLFLQLYPQSPLAVQARQELKELHPEGHTTPRHNAVLDAAIASQSAPRPSIAPAPRAGEAPAGTLVEHDLPGASAQAQPEPAATVAPAAWNAPRPAVRHGHLPLVTGVRHWSTAVYTRVAIDLDSEVQYEASRVPNPDRIFFDLHGAKISPELAGKATTVTDGGYLKRIRAAQFSGDVVRVVLDVSDVSEYSAFFLPNPSRLIIDIHGKAHGPGLSPTPSPAPVEIASASTPAPGSSAKAGQRSAAATVPVRRIVVGAGLSTPPPDSHPRPTATAQQPVDTLGEIATLDRQPDTVRATRSPTTAPVAASVADTTPAPQPGTVLTPAPDLTSHATHTSRAEAKAARAHGITPADTPAPAIHAAVPAEPVRAAAPTATGERSMVRALGLKIGRIVVDAGHGGHDSGTLGPGGIEEKDVVLDVALRLGKLLKQRLGADVIYTRDDDTFIPLETRTAIANKAQADLFISVHANSSQDSSARGVETYYLNFTTSADALEVAARENAVSDQSIHQLSDLVKKITLQDKISESREFASDVDQSLYSGLEAGNPGLKDRGVKKAPFVVLIGANMPSILAEISFLTNPDDAHQLRDPEYRERIAESLYRGVAKYIGSLSGVHLAEGSTHPSGQ